MREKKRAHTQTQTSTRAHWSVDNLPSNKKRVNLMQLIEMRNSLVFVFLCVLFKQTSQPNVVDVLKQRANWELPQIFPTSNGHIESHNSVSFSECRIQNRTHPDFVVALHSVHFGVWLSSGFELYSVLRFFLTFVRSRHSLSYQFHLFMNIETRMIITIPTNNTKS